jgi:hypothetical protein
MYAIKPSHSPDPQGPLSAAHTSGEEERKAALAVTEAFQRRIVLQSILQSLYAALAYVALVLTAIRVSSVRLSRHSVHRTLAMHLVHIDPGVAITAITALVIFVGAINIALATAVKAEPSSDTLQLAIWSRWIARTAQWAGIISLTLALTQFSSLKAIPEALIAAAMALLAIVSSVAVKERQAERLKKLLHQHEIAERLKTLEEKMTIVPPVTVDPSKSVEIFAQSNGLARTTVGRLRHILLTGLWSSCAVGDAGDNTVVDIRLFGKGHRVRVGCAKEIAKMAAWRSTQYVVVATLSLGAFILLGRSSFRAHTAYQWWAVVHLGAIFSVMFAGVMVVGVLAPLAFAAVRSGPHEDAQGMLWRSLLPGATMISVLEASLMLPYLYNGYWYAALATMTLCVGLVVLPTAFLVNGVLGDPASPGALPSFVACYWMRQTEQLLTEQEELLSEVGQ